MSSDQKRCSTLYVIQNQLSGRWDVNEEGHEKPLAFFTREKDALQYAKDIAYTRKSASVRVFA